MRVNMDTVVHSAASAAQVYIGAWLMKAMKMRIDVATWGG